MKKILLSFVIVTFLFIAGFISVKDNISVYAYDFGMGISIDGPDNGFGEGQSGIEKTVETIFDTIITIAQIAFVVLFLVGGIMYLTSAGNEDSTGKARKLMIDAVIGMVIVLASWAVGTWILNRLQGKEDSNTTSTQSSPNPSATNTALPDLEITTTGTLSDI